MILAEVNSESIGYITPFLLNLVCVKFALPYPDVPELWPGEIDGEFCCH